MNKEKLLHSELGVHPIFIPHKKTLSQSKVRYCIYKVGLKQLNFVFNSWGDFILIPFVHSPILFKYHCCIWKKKKMLKVWFLPYYVIYEYKSDMKLFTKGLRAYNQQWRDVIHHVSEHKRRNLQFLTLKGSKARPHLQPLSC